MHAQTRRSCGMEPLVNLSMNACWCRPGAKLVEPIARACCVEYKKHVCMSISKHFRQRPSGHGPPTTLLNDCHKGMRGRTPHHTAKRKEHVGGHTVAPQQSALLVGHPGQTPGTCWPARTRRSRSPCVIIAREGMLTL